MGLMDRVLGRRTVVRVSAPSPRDVLGQTPEQLYRTQPALRAVVSFLADNVAQLPLHVYRRAGDNDRRRDHESAAARLVERPNDRQTLHELVRDTMGDYLLYGWAAWWVVPDAESPSGWSVNHIPSAWFVSQPSVDGLEPFNFHFTNPTSGKRVVVPGDEMVRFSMYGVAGPLSPAPPVDALRQVLSEQISAWQFRNGVWRNGGMVNRYLVRPKDAPQWSEEGRKRFASSWKERFSGRDGVDTGGTPILEDGMELKDSQLNAREAQWAEACTLTREDVSAVYHVNPAIIWHTDGQTYASARDNARALYADTLAPILDMLEERIDAFLLPMVGAPADCYAEFNLDAKLQGSFEERAAVLQSAIGRPWMTVDEGRALNNLPAIDTGDELCIPLNVLLGGDGYVDPSPGAAAAAAPAKAAPAEKSFLSAPSVHDAQRLSDLMARYFERQGRSVTKAVARAEEAGCATELGEDGWPAWWQAERWDRELAEDLAPVFVGLAASQAAACLASMGLPTSSYDEARTEAYLHKMAEGKAKATNDVTFRQLWRAVTGKGTGDGATVAGVFEKAVGKRAPMQGTSFATSVAGWAAIEAVDQAAPQSGARKTWVTVNPRPRESHAAMNGETVGYRERFSNGAMWPGDTALSADETCNCDCQVRITI